MLISVLRTASSNGALFLIYRLHFLEGFLLRREGSLCRPGVMHKLDAFRLPFRFNCFIPSQDSSG